MYTQIYVYIYTYIHICIYIYIERERERDICRITIPPTHFALRTSYAAERSRCNVADMLYVHVHMLCMALYRHRAWVYTTISLSLSHVDHAVS